MKVRLAASADIPRALEIYEYAKQFMKQVGNPTQWNGAYPQESLLQNDVKLGWLYVIEDDDHICGVFALTDVSEPVYDAITEGVWASDTPYGTIHRIAGDGTQSGLFSLAVDFALQKFSHLRVDTHPDNLPMQKAIAKKGFVKRGVVYVEDGSPRYAYDYLVK